MKKYELLNPVEIKSEKETLVVKEIVLEKIKAKHLKFLPDGAFSGQESAPHLYIPFIAALSGIKQELIEEIEIEDFINIIDIVGDLLLVEKQSQPTIKK